MLGVDCKLLAGVIEDRREIGPGLALRFEGLGWGSARVWVEMQAQYDLARERKLQTGAEAVAQPSAETPGAVPAGAPGIAACGA